MVSLTQNNLDMKLIPTKMPEVLEWLKACNPRAHNSRYSNYIDHIKDFYKDSSIPIDEREKKFKLLSKSYQECLEIILLMETFKLEKSENFNKRLKKVIEGQDFLSAEKPHHERNFMYEMLIACQLKNMNYTIEFNDSADVVAKLNNISLYIECKRLSSTKSLKRNFEKACKQLNYINNKNPYGLVFIDVSYCLTDSLRDYEYSSIAEMTSEIETAISKFVKQNNDLIENINHKYLDNSLCLVLNFRKSLWLSNCGYIYYNKYSAIAHSKISEEKFSLISSLLEGLSNTTKI